MKTAAELAKEHGVSIDDVVGLTAEIEKHAKMMERYRIAQIMEYGIGNNDMKNALNLAFCSELSAEDAIQIMAANQSAELIRAN